MIPFTDWNLAQAFCAHQFYAASSFFITFSDMVPFEKRSWLFVVFSTDVKYFLYTVNQYMYRVQRCKGADGAGSTFKNNHRVFSVI